MLLLFVVVVSGCCCGGYLLFVVVVVVRGLVGSCVCFTGRGCLSLSIVVFDVLLCVV